MRKLFQEEWFCKLTVIYLRKKNVLVLWKDRRPPGEINSSFQKSPVVQVPWESELVPTMKPGAISCWLTGRQGWGEGGTCLESTNKCCHQDKSYFNAILKKSRSLQRNRTVVPGVTYMDRWVKGPLQWADTSSPLGTLTLPCRRMGRSSSCGKG